MSPCRVLTISKPYVAAAYREKLSLLAADPRFEIGLICPPAWGAQAFEPAADDGGYWLRRLPILANGRNHFHVYRGLERAVREFAPDVINIEEEHYSLVTAQAFRVARRVGAAPVFYTWQNIHKRYPPPFSLIERHVLANASVAVCGNHEAATVLQAKGYRGPVREIPQMGVNLGLFTRRLPEESREALRARLNLPASAFLAGFVGRLVEEKGIDTLIGALRRLPADVHVVLVGDGPDSARLRQAAADHGVESRVRLVGPVASAAVGQWIKALDALCLPSLTRANWKEQFGRVLVEAMAAGTNVVGSDSGEIPHVIADAGLVFPEGDADALASALGRLRSDPALRQALVGKGLDRARERYSNAVVAAAFAEVFLTAAGRARRE